MGWFGKLTFGSLGLFLGGPLGAIAGAALGHHLVDRQESTQMHDPGTPPGYQEQTQAAYFVSMFSILGKLATADGIITPDEIRVVDHFINGLPISLEEKQFARQIFNEAGTSDFSIDDFAIQMHSLLKNQPSMRLSFFDMLFQVAAADGRFSPGEEAALQRIKDIFQISDVQYANIKSRYFNQIDRYYKILNCTPENSDQEIKSSYKKLVKEFHPDTIISKGLPDAFVNFASTRFREIQEAYEKIRQERNF